MVKVLHDHSEVMPFQRVESLIENAMKHNPFAATETVQSNQHDSLEDE